MHHIVSSTPVQPPSARCSDTQRVYMAGGMELGLTPLHSNRLDVLAIREKSISFRCNSSTIFLRASIARGMAASSRESLAISGETSKGACFFIVYSNRATKWAHPILWLILAIKDNSISFQQRLEFRFPLNILKILKIRFQMIFE